MSTRAASDGASELVVITGLGALCALGQGIDALWEGVSQGQSGIARLERFADRLPKCLAATLPAPWSDPSRWSYETDEDPLDAIALAAAREAWSHARLDQRGLAPERVAIVFGTSGGGMMSRSRYELGATDPARRDRLLDRSRPQHVARVIAEALEVAGPRLTVSTACTSSAQAVAHGVELLAAQAVDVVVAGGAEVVAPEFVAGFHALGVLGAQPCAPFSEPVGMSIGEGAAFVVLERASSAQAQGVESLAVLEGHGLSADGVHATAPDPTGAGLARAIGAALDHARCSPENIGYVNAHGTGTEANDPAECRGLARAFGAHLATLPVSSSKGHLGHTRGAAGALELVTTVLALRHQLLPPTLHYAGPRRGASPPLPIPGPLPRPHRFDRAVTINAAFGGTNSAIVVGRSTLASSPQSPPPSSRVGRRGAVALLGHAALRAATTSEQASSVDGSLPAPRRIPPSAVNVALRGMDTRGVDTLSRYLTATTVQALDAAGVRLRGGLRDRAGLLVGASWLPWDSAAQFWGSIRERGFDRASAPAFARLVMNAPAGAVSRALGLRGPLSVIAGGVGSTLRALVLARWMLLGRSDVDLFVVASALEAGADGLAGSCCESASSVVLAAPGRIPTERDGAAIDVVGGALAGPGGLATAVRDVLAQRGARVDQLDAVFAAGHDASGTGSTGSTGSTDQALTSGLAEALGPRLQAIPCVHRRQDGQPSEADDALSLGAALDLLGSAPEAPRMALVVARDEAAGSVAVLLERPSVGPVGGRAEASGVR